MSKLEMKSGIERKKVLPVVMAVVNKIINEIGIVEMINKATKWNEAHWAISPGGLAKAFIISTFTDMRAPLIHIPERLEGIDMEYLIGEEADLKNINTSNIGRALERIGEADHESIYETAALSAITMNDINTTRFHSDTTTISFYGEYDVEKLELTEAEKEELIKIERGYNKDGRPECKQVVIGQITTETGIPIVSKALDGAASDVEWNQIAIKYLRDITEKGFSKGIYVADCKVVTEELIKSMTDSVRPIQFVSRCPANFANKLESRMIEQAYKENQWANIGQYHEGPNAAEYYGKSYIAEVYGEPLRLLVLKSMGLAKKAEASLKKAEETLKTAIKILEKKTFVCEADAEEELNRFDAMKELKLFNYVYDIEKRTLEKWPPGRRSTKTKPIVVEYYQIQIHETTWDEDAHQRYLRNESSFVVISNVINGLSDYELLKTYKGQQVVENSFRLLKEPQLASVIYLKNPLRIAAMNTLLSFSLLLRAIVQHRLRTGLEAFESENPGVKVYSGWGGRPLKNPTFKLFYEHTINCRFERENYHHYSFSWPHFEARAMIEPLLAFLGYSLEQLVA